MENFAEYVTPEKAMELDLALDNGRRKPLSYYRELSENNSICQCGDPVWKLADTGLCFSCTTGESDASEDYEIQ